MISPIYPILTKHIRLVQILMGTGVMLFIIYWIVPVFFLLIKKPAFALAWARGTRKWESFKNYDFDNVPLSDKILMCMNFLLSCVVFVIFIGFINVVNHSQ